MGSDALKTLMDMREDPYARAREWKKRAGGKVIGFFCCLAPEEIIHAAGALPVRITGENRPITKSGAHLQSYCCSLARTGLDMALEGELAFMDGTVFVHTCDTMMRLSDIWRLNAGFAVHGDVVLPVRFEGGLAREYASKELAHFRDKMSELLGPIEDGALAESIELYNRNRRLLAELYDLRRENPSILPSDQAVWLVTTSALMEKSEHNDLLEEVLADLRSSGPPSDGKVRLFGIGSAMDQWEFLEMVEAVGGTLVDDDFCNGRRYFDTEAPAGTDPIESIAARLWDRQSCACKHHPERDRAACLAERAKAAGAAGAIFWLFKFCEPHAFDYPYVKKALDEAGLPSIQLEIEQGSVSIEQLRTRVEALVETIKGAGN
jgi:bzd-type benzoyl-CoA reductase N subunit